MIVFCGVDVAGSVKKESLRWGNCSCLRRRVTLAPCGLRGQARRMREVPLPPTHITSTPSQSPLSRPSKSHRLNFLKRLLFLSAFYHYGCERLLSHFDFFEPKKKASTVQCLFFSSTFPSIAPGRDQNIGSQFAGVPRPRIPPCDPGLQTLLPAVIQGLKRAERAPYPRRREFHGGNRASARPR